jgi:hypothetical protein
MKDIRRGRGRQYSPFDKFRFDGGHGDFYCGVHCFPEEYAEMLGIVRGSHAHVPEPLAQLIRAVDAEGCCFSDVDVKATDSCVFIIQGENRLKLFCLGEGHGGEVVISIEEGANNNPFFCAIHQVPEARGEDPVEGFRGNEKEILDNGSPWQLPVLMVMRMPARPLTST